jgi:hypothetical protein
MAAPHFYYVAKMELEGATLLTIFAAAFFGVCLSLQAHAGTGGSPIQFI